MAYRSCLGAYVYAIKVIPVLPVSNKQYNRPHPTETQAHHAMMASLDGIKVVAKQGCSYRSCITPATLSDIKRTMPYTHRDATEDDLPKIVEIYNFAVATRTCSCDLMPTTVASRRLSLNAHTANHRPLWVAVDSAKPTLGAIGYLGFFHFMNERPGYFITADIAIYLHPDYQAKGLGTYLLDQSINHAPALGIETLTATIFASNVASLALFRKMGFQQWGFMPRVARLEGVEKDLVLVGRRLHEAPF
jgi:L-amino acid N-acyltransferase YncA